VQDLKTKNEIRTPYRCKNTGCKSKYYHPKVQYSTCRLRMNLTFDQCYLNNEQYSLDYADTTIILYTILLVGTALYTWVHYSNAVTYLYYHILILFALVRIIITRSGKRIWKKYLLRYLLSIKYYSKIWITGVSNVVLSLFTPTLKTHNCREFLTNCKRENCPPQQVGYIFWRFLGFRFGPPSPHTCRSNTHCYPFCPRYTFTWSFRNLRENMSCLKAYVHSFYMPTDWHNCCTYPSSCFSMGCPRLTWYANVLSYFGFAFFVWGHECGFNLACNDSCPASTWKFHGYGMIKLTLWSKLFHLKCDLFFFKRKCIRWYNISYDEIMPEYLQIMYVDPHILYGYESDESDAEYESDSEFSYDPESERPSTDRTDSESDADPDEPLVFREPPDAHLFPRYPKFDNTYPIGLDIDLIAIMVVGNGCLLKIVCKCFSMSRFFPLKPGINYMCTCHRQVQGKYTHIFNIAVENWNSLVQINTTKDWVKGYVVYEGTPNFATKKYAPPNIPSLFKLTMSSIYLTNKMLNLFINHNVPKRIARETPWHYMSCVSLACMQGTWMKCTSTCPTKNICRPEGRTGHLAGI